MACRFRSTEIANLSRQLLFLSVLLAATSLLAAAAQGSGAPANNQALALSEYGVTVQIPPGWAHRQYANVHELVNLPAAKLLRPSGLDLENAARIHMGMLKLKAHSDAADRLNIVAAERQVQPTFLTIDGWPALQRQILIPRPERGEQDESSASSSEPRRMLLLVTTAVAVGNSVFRMDGTVPAESPGASATADQIKAMGQGLRFQQSGNPAQAAQDLQRLQSNPAPRTTPQQSSQAPKTLAANTSRTDSDSAGLAFNTTLGGNGTEPEIAVSTNGKNIVIASQSGGVSSQDGGQNFSASFSFPNTACGDSSLAFGRSGNFYEGSIGSDGLSGCDAQVMDVSTNNGQTFAFRSNPIVCNGSNCGFTGTKTPNGVPDQEHIAADRYNAGPPPTAGDQVYVVWRGSGGYAITCSSDSGTNWTAVAVNGDGSPDFPRVAVGEDGLVYVVYTNGDNIEMDRYTSCANGLTQQKQGAVIASSTAEVVCPVAGMDRCGGKNGFFRNDMRSPVVVVDDTNASHIYAAYATNTAVDGSGNGVNEDVVIADSNDNGDNWSTPITVNSGIPGRRYLPWVCSVGGTAYASWYDRRNATSITNDISDYFAGSASPSGGSLTAAADFQINAPATGDPQCGTAAGGFWPNAPDISTYSESCFTQPQLAGICTDGVTRCDYSSPPAGCGTCGTSNGQPKYGDYNGNACAAGRLYTVWGSATPQPITPPPTGINLFFSQKLVCCVPQIQVPGPVSISACSGTTTTMPVNICNTGKADLQVNSISSSNTKITVANPTSGYPLVISQDSCFPAQVSLAPGSSTGTISGTLTISSNDTVNPSATVQINGDSPAASINAIVANGGSFGNECPGSQSTQGIQITNQSSCNLVVSNIVTSPNFLPPSVSLPLTLTADATVTLPITFSPSAAQTCSNTNPLTGTVVITSNDPVNGTLTENVSGLVPCPSINTTMANSGSFGNVCAATQQDMNLQVLNQGACNLNIASITSSNPGAFVLPAATTYPLILSPDANVNIPVRFEPSGVCNNTIPQTSKITVSSNDPTQGSLVQNVSGIEGCPTLVLSPQNLTGAFAYPATVSDPTGTLGCFTDRQITVSNSGICPLTITNLSTSNGLDGINASLPPSPLEFKVVNPTVPITIAPGGAAVPITVRFNPTILTHQFSNAPDQQTGTLNITSNDPVATDNLAGLCGEPTYHSGVRVLVVNSSSQPITSVKSIALTSKGVIPKASETLAPAPLASANVCGNTVQYQLDNETLPPAGTTGNNPKGSYTVSAKQGSTQATSSFSLGQCQMQQMVLQIK